MWVGKIITASPGVPSAPGDIFLGGEDQRKAAVEEKEQAIPVPYGLNSADG